MTQESQGETAPTPDPSEAERWAREHIHFMPGPSRGKKGIVWIAQLRAEGHLFERRAFGEIRYGDSVRKNAADEVVRDYLEYMKRTEPRP